MSHRSGTYLVTTTMTNSKRWSATATDPAGRSAAADAEYESDAVRGALEQLKHDRIVAALDPPAERISRHQLIGDLIAAGWPSLADQVRHGADPLLILHRVQSDLETDEKLRCGDVLRRWADGEYRHLSDLADTAALTDADQNRQVAIERVGSGEHPIPIPAKPEPEAADMSTSDGLGTEADPIADHLTSDDRCPHCGSDAIVEQSRPDDPPFACLNCSGEFERPADLPEMVRALSAAGIDTQGLSDAHIHRIFTNRLAASDLNVGPHNDPTSTD